MTTRWVQITPSILLHDPVTEEPLTKKNKDGTGVVPHFFSFADLVKGVFVSDAARAALDPIDLIEIRARFLRESEGSYVPLGEEDYAKLVPLFRACTNLFPLVYFSPGFDRMLRAWTDAPTKDPRNQEALGVPKTVAGGKSQ
jgi:hypothetical protein